MNKIIVLLMTAFMFLTGCRGFYIPGSFGAGFVCDSRYEKKEAAPFFEDVRVPDPGSKAMIVLYQPYFRACGSSREGKDHKIMVAISINGEIAMPNLAKDHFAALLIDPRKINFSAVRTIKESWGPTSVHKLGKLELKLKAGKVYFLRWSNRDEYRPSLGWFTRANQFQLLNKQTALKELQGVLYTAPLLYKAPVFDKKTGKSL